MVLCGLDLVIEFDSTIHRTITSGPFAVSPLARPTGTDQAAFESTLAEVCSASITSAQVRWSGKIQFSPGSTSRARIGESGNNSGRAFFHLANATLFAISRSLT